MNVTWETPGTQNCSLQLLLLWAEDTFAGDDNGFKKSESAIHPPACFIGIPCQYYIQVLTHFCSDQRDSTSQRIQGDFDVQRIKISSLGLFSFQYVYPAGQFVLPGVNSQGLNVTRTGTPGKVWSGTDDASSADAGESSPLTANTTGLLPAGPSNTPSSNDSNGLGTGAIAGPVIGIVAALLLMFGAVLCFLRRKWKQNSYHSTGSGEPLYMYKNIGKNGFEKTPGLPIGPIESGGATLHGELFDERYASSELPGEVENYR